MGRGAKRRGKRRRERGRDAVARCGRPDQIRSDQIRSGAVFARRGNARCSTLRSARRGVERRRSVACAVLPFCPPPPTSLRKMTVMGKNPLLGQGISSKKNRQKKRMPTLWNPSFGRSPVDLGFRKHLRTGSPATSPSGFQDHGFCKKVVKSPERSWEGVFCGTAPVRSVSHMRICFCPCGPACSLFCILILCGPRFALPCIFLFRFCRHVLASFVGMPSHCRAFVGRAGARHAGFLEGRKGRRGC